MSRDITCCSVVVTTDCKRRCPHCCCGAEVIEKPPVYFDLPYFGRAAAALKGHVSRIHLTGGEPMLHPEIEAIAALFKDAGFLVTMETAWHALPGSIVQALDRVYLTQPAPERGVPWLEDDGFLHGNWLADISTYNSNCHLIVGKVTHRTEPRGNRKCDRGYAETVSYFKHRIYPCCVAWAVPGSDSVPVGGFVDLCMAEPACDNCIFGEANDVG